MRKRLSSPAEDTLAWLQQAVVGLNLCPFAAPVLASDAVDIVVSDAQGSEALLTDTVQELQRVVATPATTTDTVLLVFANALTDFDDYCDFAALADAAIDTLALRGVLQLATFHPDYQFEGTEPDARENYTNRSPWPMLHVLREQSLEVAIASHPDTAKIPERNRQLLEAMPEDRFMRVFESTQG